MRLDLFANRVEKVYFGAGVVRIEFSVIRPNDKGEVSPDMAVSPDDIHFSVTLPLAGFTRSMGELRKFMQDLQSKGVLKGQDDARAERNRRQSQLPDLTSGGDGEEPVV